jgi:hypothetical protein
MLSPTRKEKARWQVFGMNREAVPQAWVILQRWLPVIRSLHLDTETVARSTPKTGLLAAGALPSLDFLQDEYSSGRKHLLYHRKPSEWSQDSGYPPTAPPSRRQKTPPHNPPCWQLTQDMPKLIECQVADKGYRISIQQIEGCLRRQPTVG